MNKMEDEKHIWLLIQLLHFGKEANSCIAIAFYVRLYISLDVELIGQGQCFALFCNDTSTLELGSYFVIDKIS